MSLNRLVNNNDYKNSKEEIFPYAIKTINSNLNDQLLKDFTGSRNPFLQVGPKNYVLPNGYAKEAEGMYNFEVRSDDVFVLTFPRSGTTVTQELVWLLCNNLDYKKAARIPLMTRFPYYDQNCRLDKSVKAEVMELNKNNPKAYQWLKYLQPIWKILPGVEEQRFIKSHLPLSLLPPALTNGDCKVIYVARNPLDLVVSYFLNCCTLRLHSYQNDFKTFWKYFINDLVVCAPYWEHVKEAWEKRHQENFLFLFYENLTKNMSEELKKIAAFLGKSYTKDELEQLEYHLDIENFKKNPSVNLHDLRAIGFFTDRNFEGFIRKGVTEGYKGYFDEEMLQEAQQWISVNLKDTDLTFPVQLS